MQTTNKAEISKALPGLQKILLTESAFPEEIKGGFHPYQCIIACFPYLCEKMLRPHPTICSFRILPQDCQEAQVLRYG